MIQQSPSEERAGTALERAQRRADVRAKDGKLHIEGSIYEGMEACLVRNGRTIAHVVKFADALALAELSDKGSLDICPVCNGSGVGVADTTCSLCNGSGGVPLASQAAQPAEADGVERLAQYLHDEGGFDNAWPDYTWPEHEGDTGQRDGGWVRIVPSDVQAHFRDVARRWLRRSAALAATPKAPAAGAGEVDDDGPCTDCRDTGLTIQTERPCSCEAGDQYRATPPAPNDDLRAALERLSEAFGGSMRTEVVENGLWSLRFAFGTGEGARERMRAASDAWVAALKENRRG